MFSCHFWAGKWTVDLLKWDCWWLFPSGSPLQTLSWCSWSTHRSSGCWSFLSPRIAQGFPLFCCFGREWYPIFLSWTVLASPRSLCGLHRSWCLGLEWNNLQCTYRSFSSCGPSWDNLIWWVLPPNFYSIIWNLPPWWTYTCGWVWKRWTSSPQVDCQQWNNHLNP